jgi:hypothetical protein
MNTLITVLSLLTLLQSEPASAPTKGPRVRIGTVDGRSMECTLRAIDPRKGLIYDADQDQLTMPRDDIEQLTLTERPTGKPSTAPGEQLLYLEGGGQLHGTILPGDGSSGGKLRFACAIAPAMDVPFDAIKAVRFATSPIQIAQQELTQRLVDRTAGRDLLLVMREGKPVVLPGALESVDAAEWTFRFGTRVQKSALQSAYAVILGGSPNTQTGRDTLMLNNGDVVTGSVVSADAGNVELDAGRAGRWNIAWKIVRQVDLANPRIVFLSELTPAAIESHFFLDADWSPHNDRNVCGHPMRIAGRHYARGVGVHATTLLRYRLDGKYERFCAEAGIDDEAAPYGSVVFRVRGDDRELIQTPKLKGGDKPVTISVDVSGVNVLILEADAGDDLDLSDHADWAQARLIRARRSAIR